MIAAAVGWIAVHGGDECASGFCRADGTYPPAGSMPQGTCVDGPRRSASERWQITLASHRIARPMATFRVAPDPLTRGTASAAARALGSHRAARQRSDRTVRLVCRRVVGAGFPAATYAVRCRGPTCSAFSIAGHRCSGRLPEAGVSHRLAYDPPAAILAVPFAAGATWSSTSTVSGTAQGAIVAYTERYESRVDGVGTMTTPYGEFPVLRIATDLTRTQGLATLTTNRTFAWTAECFGAVATVTSQSFETSAEFDDPAEVRRLAP
jgi:hypothetical protein